MKAFAQRVADNSRDHLLILRTQKSTLKWGTGKWGTENYESERDQTDVQNLCPERAPKMGPKRAPKRDRNLTRLHFQLTTFRSHFSVPPVLVFRSTYVWGFRSTHFLVFRSTHLLVFRSTHGLVFRSTHGLLSVQKQIPETCLCFLSQATRITSPHNAKQQQTKSTQPTPSTPNYNQKQPTEHPLSKHFVCEQSICLLWTNLLLLWAQILLMGANICSEALFCWKLWAKRCTANSLSKFWNPS